MSTACIGDIFNFRDQRMVAMALRSHVTKQVLRAVTEEANIAELVGFLARNTGLVSVTEIVISFGSLVDLNKVLQ